MSEIIRSEHRAIVFKLSRKQAAGLARYIKDHSGAQEVALAVDADTMEMIVQAKNTSEEDILVFDGEEDVFDVEEEIVEENEEVLIPVDEEENTEENAEENSEENGEDGK